jgi:hypothetical protein
MNISTVDTLNQDHQMMSRNSANNANPMNQANPMMTVSTDIFNNVPNLSE